MLKKVAVYLWSLFFVYTRKLKVRQKILLVSPSVLRKIGKKTTISGDAILSGNVLIGSHCSIYGPGTMVVGKGKGIVVGSFSSIGPGTKIFDYSHNIDRVTTSYINSKLKSSILNLPDIVPKEKIAIGEDVWIGSNVVILPGVQIGRGSVIGAGSVVTSNIPEYSIAVGNPCKVVKKRFNDEQADFLNQSKWWLSKDLLDQLPQVEGQLKSMKSHI